MLCDAYSIFGLSNAFFIRSKQPFRHLDAVLFHNSEITIQIKLITTYFIAGHNFAALWKWGNPKTNIGKTGKSQCSQTLLFQFPSTHSIYRIEGKNNANKSYKYMRYSVQSRSWGWAKESSAPKSASLVNSAPKSPQTRYLLPFFVNNSLSSVYSVLLENVPSKTALSDKQS